MRNKLRKLIKENFYIDHLDCSEECSKRWYAENSVEEAVEEIMQLFNEAKEEMLEDFAEYCHTKYNGTTRTENDDWEYSYKDEVIIMAEEYLKNIKKNLE